MHLYYLLNKSLLVPFAQLVLIFPEELLNLVQCTNVAHVYLILVILSRIPHLLKHVLLRNALLRLLPQIFYPCYISVLLGRRLLSLI